ncbi:hypothetical protein SLS64_014329 [Diaporthe eres]
MFGQGWLADVYRERADREILRFDDTNPGKEEGKYFIEIEKTIRWLGLIYASVNRFEPSAVTYTSDNFQRLYELAEKLIGWARPTSATATRSKLGNRGEGKTARKDRGTAASTRAERRRQLHKFRAMRDGEYKHEDAFLRMKQDIDNPNPQMWDLVAYRIPPADEAHHYRTKDKWKIYPTYDFAHCLCDSFEGITHSLCTTEFTLSRESYEWLIGTLGVYKPMQREFGKSITFVVIPLAGLD